MADSRIATLKPGFCCFGITDDCMLRCKMCDKWKGDLQIKENTPPTLAQWKECVDDLSKMVSYPFELDIGGGEALMFPGVLDVVSHSVAAGFNTSIASNGWLIDDDMARRIADAGLKSISISMDSNREDIHDFLRGVPGVYRRAWDAIGHLKKHNPKLWINLCCVFYEYNQETIVDLVEMAQNDSRVGSINFMAAMQPNNTAPTDDWWSSDRGHIWPRDPERTVQILQQVIDRKKKGYRIGNPLSQLLAFQAYYREPKKFVKRKQCNLDRCVLVSSVGDIYLCYDYAKIGNIKQDRLIDVWYSEKADAVRKEISRCTRNCHHLMNCFDEFDKDYPGEG